MAAEATINEEITKLLKKKTNNDINSPLFKVGDLLFSSITGNINLESLKEISNLWNEVWEDCMKLITNEDEKKKINNTIVRIQFNSILKEVIKLKEKSDDNNGDDQKVNKLKPKSDDDYGDGDVDGDPDDDDDDDDDDYDNTNNNTKNKPKIKGIKKKQKLKGKKGKLKKKKNVSTNESKETKIRKKEQNKRWYQRYKKYVTYCNIFLNIIANFRRTKIINIKIYKYK